MVGLLKEGEGGGLKHPESIKRYTFFYDLKEITRTSWSFKKIGCNVQYNRKRLCILHNEVGIWNYVMFDCFVFSFYPFETISKRKKNYSRVGGCPLPTTQTLVVRPLKRKHFFYVCPPLARGIIILQINVVVWVYLSVFRICIMFIRILEAEKMRS